MFTAFALPGVTHVLRRLLQDAAPPDAATVLGEAKGWQVSTVAPDLVQRGPKEPPLLNLFLYHVAPNRSWRNLDARTHDAAGNRVAAPPLALDLHYLLTAYGTADYQAEILLGHAMLALHEHAVLSRDLIAAAFDPNVSLEALMGASGLDAQVEAVGVTLEALEADGLERLWTGLQLALRPSASYLVTVLLLQSRARVIAAPPATSRTITTVPLERPRIDTVAALAGGAEPIEPGTAIAVDGARLIGDATALLIGEADLAAAIDRDAPGYPDRLTLTLPDPMPPGLSPGTRGVQVRHGVRFPGDALPRPLVASNMVAVSVRPKVTGVGRQADAGGGAGLAVTFAHEIGDRQQVTVILLPILGGATAGAGLAQPVPPGNFDTPERTPRADLRTVWLPVAAPAGSYAVQATVDGLASVPREPADSVTVTLP